MRDKRDEADGVLADVLAAHAAEREAHQVWLARVTQERDQARAALETTKDALRRIVALEAQVRFQRDAALALHVSAENYTGCRACNRDWPCDTRRALGADDD